MDHPKHNGTAGLGTRAVWSGERGERWAGATQVSVALSVSFGYKTVEEWLDAGKFDQTTILQWVAETLGRIPRPARTLEATYTVEPTQDGERSVILRRMGSLQRAAVMYHVPAGSHPDSAALEVLSDVLGDTPSGRLYKALVDTKKAAAAGMIHLELHDPAVILAFAILRQEQSLDDAHAILLKNVESRPATSQ